MRKRREPQPPGRRKKRPKRKRTMKERAEGVQRSLLWVLGMLYVFGMMAAVVTVLSLTGVIEPSERPGSQISELELVPSEPTTCHPSYSECLDPDAEDYDCRGGRVQDGPRFVEGPVTVDGPDPFELDGDNDGIGCEDG